jgi:hypothetical protein
VFVRDELDWVWKDKKKTKFPAAFQLQMQLMPAAPMVTTLTEL